MKGWTHEIKSSKQRVIMLPSFSYGRDGKFPLCPSGYRRVIMPFTEAELSRRTDNVKGHVQVVRLDALKARAESLALHA